MRGYIPGLDGLRGLAILLVLMIHLICCGQSVAPQTIWDLRLLMVAYSGWCGVNLFFVLSGFLITGILYDTKDLPHRARNFYARRTLRIWPLYYGVLILWLLILPRIAPESMGVGCPPPRHQLWAWLYAVNWGCLVDGIAWPLIHFWSLAIEEHFYLLWPFVIWGCRRGTAIRVCIACIVVSTAIREFQVMAGVAPTVIWMIDTAHLDSLGLGGLIALAARGPRGSFILVRPARYVAVLSAMALGLVVYQLRAVNHMSPAFQAYGITPLVALFGSALILVAHAPRLSPIGLLFNSALMRFFGKYSYGLYVWHGVLMVQFDRWFPIASYQAALGSVALAVLLHAALATAVSIVVTLLSYHVFEKQFLKLKVFFEYRSSEAADDRSPGRPRPVSRPRILARAMAIRRGVESSRDSRQRDDTPV